MTTEIRFHGLRYSAALHTFALRHIEARLCRFTPPLTRVILRISDLNGPRGGADKRCRIVVLGPGLGTAAVQSRNEDAYGAVRACIARAVHVVARKLARARSAPASASPRGDRTDAPRARMIRVTGVLDLTEALRLAPAIVDAPGRAEIHVDVRAAREVHDAAVVTLARAVARRSGTIVGLSRHHATLLDYVGPLGGEAAR